MDSEFRIEYALCVNPGQNQCHSSAPESFPEGCPRLNRSPWVEQLEPDPEPHPLPEDCAADVVVIGAGIAGVAKAFYLLRDTSKSVVLIERDRVGRGASGHNAGQLVTYFERPLCDLVDCYGFDKAIAAQRAVDGARDLLDEMLAACGRPERPQRFLGHMGMFTLNHVLVHLRNLSLRQRGGLQQEYCRISEDAPFLARIPAEYRAFYTVVPQSQIRELLGTRDNRYCAVLSNLKAWVNRFLCRHQ